MSGLDPLAALASDAALAQSSLAAIDLGVAIEILTAQLAVGDLITATVLPPQGGTDRLALLGQTVVAQLPPGVDPGQSLLLQVTAFSGNQIVVRNLGVVDPANLPPTVQISLPQVPPGSASQATLTTVIAPDGAAVGNLPLSPPAPAGAPPAAAASTAPQTSSAPPGVTPAGPLPGGVAPPRAVFVAASVLPSATASARTAPPASGAAPATPGPAGSAAPAPNVPPAATPLAASDLGVVAAEITRLGLEARIAATRAASIDIGELVTGASKRLPGDASAGSGAPAPFPGAVAAGTTPSAGTTATAGTAGGATPSAGTTTSSGAPAPATSPAGGSAIQAVAPRAAPAAASTELVLPPSLEAALLTRLRIPAFPLTLAAAKLAADAGSAVPRALAHLDALLSDSAGLVDARAGSVRALAGFVARLDLGNVRALPEQLMAYVSNVVAGSESKLAALLRAFAADGALPEDGAFAQDPVAPSPGTASSPATAAAAIASAASDAAASDAAVPAASSPAAAAAASDSPGTLPASAAQLPPGAAAHAVERATALQYDLKANLISLIESPARGAPAELAPALTAALTAVTALQINVLSAQQTDPSTLAIPLPVFFHEGGRPVQLRVSREAPRGGKLDADNFHIAFVLDTRSLGTVAVDLQTAGRAVNVSVKTEGATAAGRFQNTLDALRGRLEQLHYRVASIAAAVAPHRGAAAATAPVESAPPGSTSAVDMRA